MPSLVLGVIGKSSYRNALDTDVSGNKMRGTVVSLKHPLSGAEVLKNGD